MAVINCPSCQKKISDKTKNWSHCRVDLSSADPEQLASLRKVDIINKSQKIMTLSFIAMLLFCGGFLFFYWYEVQPGTWQYTASLTSAVAGFGIYIITRIQLILLKSKSKSK